MRLLILSTMKPMIEPFITEQTNSVLSWTKLRIKPTIIIFGNDKGVPEFCKTHDLINKEVKTNEKGVPYISDIFNKGYEYMDLMDSLLPDETNKNKEYYDYVMYINADILLMDDFCDTIEAFDKTFPDTKSCLITSIRYNIKNFTLIDFEDEKWKTKVSENFKGEYEKPDGIDIFLHKKNNYKNMPNFAIARMWYDSYLHCYGVKKFEISVNTTKTTKIYHHFGKWYQNNKIVERNNSNLDYQSFYKNMSYKSSDIYEHDKALITNCSYYSTYQDNNIVFVKK